MQFNNEKTMSRNIILSVFLIIILGFAVYSNSLSGTFFWDDNGLIKNNTSIKSWTNIDEVFTGDMMVDGRRKWAFYRPIQTLTYMIDHSLWKLNPTGYHLTNILLHIAAALSIYWLIQTIFKDYLLSLLTGVFFVIHPVHTEAVAYISGRADSLSLLFMLLCFVLYIKDQSSKNIGLFVLMLISYALALLSKEGSLILPVLLLLYHYSFKKEIKVKAFCSITSLALIYVLMRATVLTTLPPPSASYATTLMERLPGFFVAITSYIRLLLLPFDLHMEYGSKLFALGDPKSIFGAVILFASLIYAFRKRKSNPLVFFSVTWFFIALLPVSNLYPINAYMAEHWLYLPSIGFFLIMAKTISVGATSRPPLLKILTVIFAIGLITFYSYLTIRQNIFWREPVSFYKRSLNYSPDSPTVYNNLGNVYWAEGKYDEAITAYQKAIEIKPDYAKAYYNLGNAYKAIDKNEEAADAYRKATEIREDYAEAYYNLGVVYKDIHQSEKAMDAYRKAIAIQGDYAEAHNNLGGAYAAMNKKEEAIASYEKAVESKPDYADAHYSLGVLYNAAGRREEAVASYKKAIAINADDAGAYDDLANIFFRNQQYQLAIEYGDRAKELGLINSELMEALEPYRQ